MSTEPAAVPKIAKRAHDDRNHLPVALSLLATETIRAVVERSSWRSRDPRRSSESQPPIYAPEPWPDAICAIAEAPRFEWSPSRSTPIRRVASTLTTLRAYGPTRAPAPTTIPSPPTSCSRTNSLALAVAHRALTLEAGQRGRHRFRLRVGRSGPTFPPFCRGPRLGQPEIGARVTGTAPGCRSRRRRPRRARESAGPARRCG